VFKRHINYYLKIGLKNLYGLKSEEKVLDQLDHYLNWTSGIL